MGISREPRPEALRAEQEDLLLVEVDGGTPPDPLQDLQQAIVHAPDASAGPETKTSKRLYGHRQKLRKKGILA